MRATCFLCIAVSLHGPICRTAGVVEPVLSGDATPPSDAAADATIAGATTADAGSICFVADASLLLSEKLYRVFGLPLHKPGRR